MYQSFYTGALGAGTCMAKMSVISNNISNINNDGFRPKTAAFSNLLEFNLNDSEDAVTELMSGNGVRMQRTYTTYETLPVTTTNSEYDYAIGQDNAFFMVQDPGTGEITYTRNGHFHLGEMEDGFYLTTDAGKLVLDQYQKPIKAEVPEMKNEEEEDEDYDSDELEETPEDAPRVSLYTFSNPSRLLSTDSNEVVPPEGMEPILVEKPKLTQKALEVSGTELAKEMVRMIECQRAYSYALKMVVTADEIESTINSLRG